MKVFRARLGTPVLAALVSFAGLLPSAPGARAHGADWEVRIVGQRLDGYAVTVRTAPKQPQAGRLHVEIQLIDPETLTYVDRARVRATARLRGGEAMQAGPALSRYRAPWHEMDLALNKSGAWDIRLAIDGPRGQREVAFRVDVLSARSGLVSDPRGDRATPDHVKPTSNRRMP